MINVNPEVRLGTAQAPNVSAGTVVATIFHNTMMPDARQGEHFDSSFEITHWFSLNHARPETGGPDDCTRLPLPSKSLAPAPEGGTTEPGGRLWPASRRWPLSRADRGLPGGLRTVACLVTHRVLPYPLMSIIPGALLSTLCMVSHGPGFWSLMKVTKAS